MTSSGARHYVDGTREFSNLSDAELASAKVRVDASLTPSDHERLLLELRRRSERRANARRPIVLKVIGTALVLGAVLGIFGVRGVFAMQPGGVRVLFPIMIFPLALWVVAGALLLRAMPEGVWLGIAALSLQLLSFAIGNVSYVFSPLASVKVAWIAGDIHLAASALPVGHLRMGSVASTQFAVDLLAAIGLGFLIKSLRSRPRAA
jgi:hypothetical protein